jgi:hypothetical protein
VSGQLHAPAALSSLKEPAVPSLIGAWVITRVGMDRSGEEKKNPFPHYNTGQNHNTKTANKFLKNVIKFEYLGATL